MKFKKKVILILFSIVLILAVNCIITSYASIKNQTFFEDISNRRYFSYPMLTTLLIAGMFCFVYLADNGKIDENLLIKLKLTDDNTSYSRDKNRAMNSTVPSEYLSSTPDGVVVGKYKNKYVRVPFDPNTIRHCLFVAGSGGGKTSTLLTSTVSLYKSQQKENNKKVGIFAIDPKGEIYQKSVRIGENKDRVNILNPSLVDESYCGWDVYFGLDENSSYDEVEERLDAIARSLINCKPNSDNEIFYNVARQLFKGFMLYSYVKGESFYTGVMKIMGSNKNDYIAQILQDNKATEKCGKLITLLKSYEFDSSEMMQNCDTTLRENLAIFNNVSVKYFLEGNPRKASPIDLVNGNDVYLTLPINLIDQYGPLLNLIVQQVLDYLMSLPPTLRADNPDAQIILLILEELPQLGYIKSLLKALAILRSSKVMFWILIQSLAQIDDIYGEFGKRTLISNTECICVLKSNDSASNKLFSELGGQYRETMVSNSENKYSGFSSPIINQSIQYRNVFDPSDFTKIATNKKVICFIDGYAMYLDRCRYYEVPELETYSKETFESNKKYI